MMDPLRPMACSCCGSSVCATLADAPDPLIELARRVELLETAVSDLVARLGSLLDQGEQLVAQLAGKGPMGMIAALGGIGRG